MYVFLASLVVQGSGVGQSTARESVARLWAGVSEVSLGPLVLHGFAGLVFFEPALFRRLHANKGGQADWGQMQGRSLDSERKTWWTVRCENTVPDESARVWGFRRRRGRGSITEAVPSVKRAYSKSR